ncbi:MAG: hypothetical protein WCI20_02005 [bacterium]
MKDTTKHRYALAVAILLLSFSVLGFYGGLSKAIGEASHLTGLDLFGLATGVLFALTLALGAAWIIPRIIQRIYEAGTAVSADQQTWQ